MLNIFKTAYCFYVAQILLKCKNDLQLNKMLDKIIDEQKHDTFIEGDEDIKKLFNYIIAYRSYNRCLVEEKPFIESKIVLKVLAKSIF